MKAVFITGASTTTRIMWSSVTIRQAFIALVSDKWPNHKPKTDWELSMIYNYNGPESGIQQWLENEIDLLVLTTFGPEGPPRRNIEAFKKAV